VHALRYLSRLSGIQPKPQVQGAVGGREAIGREGLGQARGG